MLLHAASVHRSRQGCLTLEPRCRVAGGATTMYCDQGPADGTVDGAQQVGQRQRCDGDQLQNVGQSLDYREAYDIAAARAVAELKVLAEYCLPLVRVGGLFIAAKGHDPHEEIKDAKSAVQKLGASMLELCNVESMGPHGHRTAVIYFKERATPKKYPRLPGTPSKMPL
uniref:Ribosomal RNA methyltransferase FtsJ domain-containing protein n=1 Tax=Setaria italica TaxID=4555 RepID=K3XZM6_SETIT